MRDTQRPMTMHTTEACPACGARRVSGASACWQCGATFAALPTAPVSSPRWTTLPWAGVIPFGLFFLPWVIASPYWAHRVIPIAGLELALGLTLKGRPVPHEPLLWIVPLASLLLGALLLRARRRTPGPQHRLSVAIIAWVGFLLLLIKAVQWLLIGSSSETAWVVHWLTTEFLVSISAFFISALAATRAWMDSRGPRPQSSSSPSQDAPIDEGEIR